MATGKKKKTSTGKIILFIVEIIALIALLVVMWFVLRVTDENTGIKRIDINEADIVVNMNEGVADYEEEFGYKNIALLGIDTRGAGDSESLRKSATRSDTMIIASINQNTKDVKLVSVYRDTYLNRLGSWGYGKCNAAYAYNGPTQTVLMLNQNLDLDIKDFVVIGFEGLSSVVDALGGVYIDVDADEIKHLNNYQISMVEEVDAFDSYVPVKETGYQLLNGLQATAYCRIRYTAGNDFKRTERQREVIAACLDVAKTSNVATLKQICENVMGYVALSDTITMTDIFDVLEHISEYTIVDQAGFPTEGQITTGTIGSAGSCVIPLNLESNVVWLHKFLFGEENYTPSATVSEFSNEVYSQTSKYLSGAAVDTTGDILE